MKKSRKMTAQTNSDGTITYKKKKLNKGNLATLILTIFMILVLIVVLFLGYKVVKNLYALPEWTDISVDGYSHVYDRNENWIVDLEDGKYTEDVEFSEIPQDLIDAIISTEDTRFYDHNGIDIIRVFGALIADIKSGAASQGGSTITMQLARNAILEDQTKKLDRKIQESLLALQIEKKYTKDEILTFYVNEVFLGKNIYGFGAAAQYYFNKDISELSLSECALLVGMLPSPNNYSPEADMEKATTVRNRVLNNMVEQGFISQEEADAAKQEEIQLDIKEITTTGDYSHMIDYCITEAGDILEELGYERSTLYSAGYHIYTTIDQTTQDALEEVYADESYFPEGHGDDLLQSAAVFVEPQTGEILAMMGGRDYDTRFGLNRATDMTRQPGSVIKPISVYGPAIESGVSPNYKIEDSPIDEDEFGGYQPENYDGRYRGMINMTTALKYSVNVTAVRLLSEIGVDTGWEFAKDCGLPLVDADKNLSLALGGLTHGVSPLDLAEAYSCFANGGYHIETTSILKICDSKGKVIYEYEPEKTRVMDEDTAYAINTMLQETINSGTGTRADIGRVAAGKTGTTQLPEAFGTQKGNKDSWWAGYTPDIVGIVWMGFDKDYSSEGTPQYMVNVFGGQYPAVIWKDVVEKSLENVPESEWEKPEGYDENIDTSSSGSSTTQKEPEKPKEEEPQEPEEPIEPETPPEENPEDPETPPEENPGEGGETTNPNPPPDGGNQNGGGNHGQ
jgi:penicillin-binding protein 1A